MDAWSSDLCGARIMSMNSLRPQELIAQRRIMSDFKNDTDDETFDSSNGNASAAAFRSSRDKKDGDYIAKLICSSDESDMLAEFELLERGCNG